jgi:cobalt-zinc-cadmium efflux system membrane fusion protein
MFMLCPLFALSETITANENQFNQVELSNNAIKKLGLEVKEIRLAKALSSKLFPAQIGYAPQALTNYITPFNGYVDTCIWEIRSEQVNRYSTSNPW